jgi:hypothetical protein
MQASASGYGITYFTVVSKLNDRGPDFRQD